MLSVKQMEQKIRAFRLRRLRGMYSCVPSLFVDKDAAHRVQSEIDRQIELLGAESESDRAIERRQAYLSEDAWDAYCKKYRIGNSKYAKSNPPPNRV